MTDSSRARAELAKLIFPLTGLPSGADDLDVSEEQLLRCDLARDAAWVIDLVRRRKWRQLHSEAWRLLWTLRSLARSSDENWDSALPSLPGHLVTGGPEARRLVDFFARAMKGGPAKRPRSRAKLRRQLERLATQKVSEDLFKYRTQDELREALKQELPNLQASERAAVLRERWSFRKSLAEVGVGRASEFRRQFGGLSDRSKRRARRPRKPRE